MERIVLVAVGIFMAFGRHIGPVYRLIYNVLPGFRRFRVPAMSLTLAQFSLAALAGYGTSVLLGEMGERKGGMVKWAIGCAAVGGAVGLILMVQSDPAFEPIRSLFLAVGLSAVTLSEIIGRIEHVELETEPDFFELFVDGCLFHPIPSSAA